MSARDRASRALVISYLQVAVGIACPGVVKETIAPLRRSTSALYQSIQFAQRRAFADPLASEFAHALSQRRRALQHGRVEGFLYRKADDAFDAKSQDIVELPAARASTL